MPSQTRDLEDAIVLALADNLLTVGDILDRFGGDDPRWTMVALTRLKRDNVISGVDASYSPESVVELVQ